MKNITMEYLKLVTCHYLNLFLWHCLTYNDNEIQYFLKHIKHNDNTERFSLGVIHIQKWTFLYLSECREGEFEEEGEAGNKTKATFGNCLQVLEDEEPHL